MTNEYAIPFTCPDANDFVEVHGLLRFDADGLHLEFQSKDAVFGVFKSALKSVHVKPDQLRDLRYRKSWFRHFLILQTRDMRAIERVPGATSGEVRLKIRKADLAQAKSLSIHVSSALTDERLKRLLEESSEDG
jgi:hypothetical protein